MEEDTCLDGNKETSDNYDEQRDLYEEYKSEQSRQGLWGYLNR